ncbi:MAG: LacI family transcriptional regulator [Chloroflexi bacterium]|nr:LacI family transcriptional regulator [Chloroflexota bacterium]
MSEDAQRMSAGIRDVARLAGVAPSTVSRVLNGKLSGVSISPATVERIRTAAQQLHYRPNPWARGLRTAQTETIGVIAFDLAHPFAAELLQVIFSSCRARGYHVLVGTAEYDSSEGWMLSDILSADRVDGVILVGDTLLHISGQEDRFDEAMARLVQVHRHVVTVASRPSVAGETSIIVDNAAGVTLALEHLVRLGHHRIAHIRDGFHPDTWEDLQRIQAYYSFLASHNLPYDPSLEVTVNGRDLEAARQALRPLLGLDHPPTAVFVNNDATAITVLKAALLTGVRVPTDLSLVGFDDIAFAALSTPGLTTIRQPIHEMGSHAAGVLLDAIDGVQIVDLEPGADKTVVFAPTLVHRESCAPPPTSKRKT